jgi:uncharacterized membrane protein SpoIIM required for sporulation
MREALFVKQNSERWKQYEQLQTTDPDVIAERFIAITDDLAYAKTFYPKSKTIGYINKIAAGFHQSIYKNKKEKTGRFARFWSAELPTLFYQYRRQLLYSFLFFMVFFLIGLCSAKYDNAFVRLIMGDDYVNMTLENIAKGDPFGVYKRSGEVSMFFYIAQNNLYVTVMNFVMGLFFSVGTVFALMRNGVMVGAFQYFFIDKGLGLQSVLVIWLHGTLEMSSMIIAGGAGLVMGNSFLFPKTHTRFASLKRGAKDGLKITLGILPLIVVAAFFESFVTRHTEMPVWLSGSILLVSALFIIWYVILYPIYLNKLKG